MLFDDDYEDEDDGPASTLEDAPEVKGLLPPRESSICLGFEGAERMLLTQFNDGCLPHALIFSGPEGIGKATFAFRLARFLLKQEASADAGPSLFGDPLPAVKPSSFDVAADDTVFRQIAAGGHPDILTIERPFDEKKGRRQGNVPVEEVRRVTPFLRMTSSKDGGWRVVIIDDADTMNRNSQNAVLKILEEPPSNTLLILIAHRAGALIPTIRSRCRTVSFQPPAIDAFTKLIQNDHPQLPERDIKTVHAITNGSVGQSLRLLYEGGLEAIGKIMMLLSTWPRWNWVEIHGLADSLSRPEQEDSLRTFQDVFLWLINTILRCKAQDLPLPAILDNEALIGLQQHYSLADWIEICENVKGNFDMVTNANLDRRQAIFGIFSILSTAG